MINRRRTCLKWTAILVAYFCIFSLSFQYGVYRRRLSEKIIESEQEPRHVMFKRLFFDHGEYLNSSTIMTMIDKEFSQTIDIENFTSTISTPIRHALVVFYDFSWHHTFFQRFLWLYTSWTQLSFDERIQNDLLVFVSSSTVPDDFIELQQEHFKLGQRNQLKIFASRSIFELNFRFIDGFTLDFEMELVRLFYWQQSKLLSLLIFLFDDEQKILRHYDYLFRVDFDSMILPNFGLYSPSNIFHIGESIVHNEYTLHRLERMTSSLTAKTISKHLLKSTMTTSWFAPFFLYPPLIRRIILIALWMIKEEFTESERLHHLTYLNYPSWYIDGIFQYAASIVLSISLSQELLFNERIKFDCHHSVRSCFTISLQDPTHHLHFSKHALHLLTTLNQTDLHKDEKYLLKTVIKSNEFFKRKFLFQ